MPNYRAQVSWQGSSGLPEDRYVNVFHFSGTGTLAADTPEMLTRLLDFYYGTPPATSSIGGMFSNDIVSGELRTYDLADPEPRVPIINTMGVPPLRQGAVDLPREVAIVASIHGVPPVTPRRRGRLYIGPFNTNVNTVDGGPSATATQTIVAACTRLATASTADLLWTIYSPTTGLQVIVTAGFVDNAYDTQRRRGEAPTSRTEWSVPVP